jgi:ABC-type transporter Mla subunit MlaD
MSEAQIEDIYSRLNTLTQKVNNLELLAGTIGTSQAAIAQIYSRLDTFAGTTNTNFAQISRRFDRAEERLDRVEARLDRIEIVQSQQSQQLSEILQILRDRNGGTSI